MYLIQSNCESIPRKVNTTYDTTDKLKEVEAHYQSSIRLLGVDQLNFTLSKEAIALFRLASLDIVIVISAVIGILIKSMFISLVFNEKY